MHLYLSFAWPLTSPNSTGVVAGLVNFPNLIIFHKEMICTISSPFFSQTFDDDDDDDDDECSCCGISRLF